MLKMKKSPSVTTALGFCFWNQRFFGRGNKARNQAVFGISNQPQTRANAGFYNGPSKPVVAWVYFHFSHRLQSHPAYLSPSCLMWVYRLRLDHVRWPETVATLGMLQPSSNRRLIPSCRKS